MSNEAGRQSEPGHFSRLVDEETLQLNNESIPRALGEARGALRSASTEARYQTQVALNHARNKHKEQDCLDTKTALDLASKDYDWVREVYPQALAIIDQQIDRLASRPHFRERINDAHRLG